MKKKNYSMVSTLQRIYAAITIFLLAIVLIFSFYCLNTVKEQFNISQQQTLNLYMNEMDNAFSKTRSSLLMYQLQGTFPLMQNANSQELFRAKKIITENLASSILFLDYCDGLFVYDYEIEEFAYAFKSTKNSGEDYLTRQTIPDIAKSTIETSGLTIGSGWYIEQCGGDNYLFYFQWADGVCYGSWLNPRHLLPELPAIALQPEIALAFTDLQNHQLHDTVLNAHTEKNLTVLQSDSKIAPLRLNIYIPNFTYLSTMSSGLRILLFLSGLALLTIPLTYFAMKYIVKRPLNQVLSSIREYENGNDDFLPSDAEMPREVILINHALIKMYQEIQSLKIDIYEKQLNLKDVHLQYLQHQIKPHFVINILNAVSLMAQMKENDRIVEIIQYLSSYMRNMLNTTIRTAALLAEIKQLENYLSLQKIRYPGQITVTYHIDSHLDQYPIPILTLQTLVENIFKHALEAYKPMDIHIQAIIIENKVILSVHDNGNGFPQDFLDSFNRQAPDTLGDGTHIGLNNIRQRLELEYPGQASILLRNDNGALITISLPYA